MTKRRNEDGPSEPKRSRISISNPKSQRRAKTSSLITFSDSSSGNRLRAKKFTVPDDPPILPETTEKTDEPQDDGSVQKESDWPFSDDLPPDTPMQTESQPQPKANFKRQQNYRSWNKLAEWLPFRAEFLDEFLRHDGQGDYLGTSSCNSCGEDDSRLYKCSDCWDGSLLRCSDCLLTAHRNLPLHRIEVWNSAFFEKIALSDLGLRFQLGHAGGSCSKPIPAPKDFIVFDVTGVHSIQLDYCGCLPPPIALERRTQLLRARLLPATLARPQTAFTFELMEFFHQLSLQAKVTMYDYYRTILRRSDALSLGSIPSRSNDFHRVFRLWRVLMMLKRAGRGNTVDGIATTGPGELSLECPACPHPSKNLPPNWEQAGPFLYLYTLFLAVDANFKLKGKDRGITDLELLPGWAYFVEENAYQAHLINYVDESEINTCQSEHDAVVRAAVRCTPGYTVTGVGLVICSRHGFVRPNGVGDLQKGERYCNIDYIVFSAMVAVTLIQVVITYDIACQWSKNLHKRLDKLPPAIQPNVGKTSVKSLIPSWHINGHGPDCQTNFALIYTPGCARTCGDEIESGFAETNVIGSSVREMGGGARHEAVSDQVHGANLRKLVNLRKLLAKKFSDAAEMRKVQEEAFTKLCLTFTPQRIAEWTKMVVDWERDPKNSPNPYEEVKLETTMQDVRLQLAKEDADATAKGAISAHQTSLTSCLVIGFDLEEQQRALKYDLSTSRLSTSKQKADLQEKRNAMSRRIQRWREVQVVYAPIILALIPALTSEESDSDSALKPEDIPLYLPSDLTPALRKLIPEMSEKECRLRRAQAEDALADIRLGRRILTGLTNFKKIHLAGAGNKPNTRARSLYQRIQTRIVKAANRYRRAREALLVLDPDGDWKHRLLPLAVGDIRGPGRDPEEASSGRFVPSWIWQVPRVRLESDRALAAEELDESLRVEWAKARARSLRWEEEYWLIQEEMRRVMVYLAWKAEWWRGRARTEPFKSQDIMHGIRAYAHKQAHLFSRLAERCAADWIPLLRKHDMFPQWMPWAGYDDELGKGKGSHVELEPTVVSMEDSDYENTEWGSDTEGDQEVEDLYEFEIE